MWEKLDKLEVSKNFNFIALIFLPVAIPIAILFVIFKFFYILFVGECRAKKWNRDYEKTYYTIFVRKGCSGCVFSQIPESLFIKKYEDLKNASGPYKLELKDKDAYYSYEFSDKQRKKLVQSMKNIIDKQTA